MEKMEDKPLIEVLQEIPGWKEATPEQRVRALIYASSCGSSVPIEEQPLAKLSTGKGICTSTTPDGKWSWSIKQDKDEKGSI